MSKLSEMIARLCPNGVEYKKLGEVARIRNGRDYKHLGKGEIPVYGSGGIMTYVDSFAYDGQSVLIPAKDLWTRSTTLRARFGLSILSFILKLTIASSP